jgi:hypothetical protein
MSGHWTYHCQPLTHTTKPQMQLARGLIKSRMFACHDLDTIRYHHDPRQPPLLPGKCAVPLSLAGSLPAQPVVYCTRGIPRLLVSLTSGYSQSNTQGSKEGESLPLHISSS